MRRPSVVPYGSIPKGIRERGSLQGGSEKSRRDFCVLAELAGTLLTKSPRTLAKIDGIATRPT